MIVFGHLIEFIKVVSVPNYVRKFICLLNLGMVYHDHICIFVDILYCLTYENEIEKYCEESKIKGLK